MIDLRTRSAPLGPPEGKIWIIDVQFEKLVLEVTSSRLLHATSGKNITRPNSTIYELDYNLSTSVYVVA